MALGDNLGELVCFSAGFFWLSSQHPIAATLQTKAQHMGWISSLDGRLPERSPHNPLNPGTGTDSQAVPTTITFVGVMTTTIVIVIITAVIISIIIIIAMIYCYLCLLLLLPSLLLLFLVL